MLSLHLNFSLKVVLVPQVLEHQVVKVSHNQIQVLKIIIMTRIKTIKIWMVEMVEMLELAVMLELVGEVVHHLHELNYSDKLVETIFKKFYI